MDLQGQLSEIRPSEKEEIKTEGYVNLAGLRLKEMRQEQLQLLKEFLLTKKIEGCSKTTIQSYYKRIMQLINYSDKDVRELTTREIRDYLVWYKDAHDVTNSTLDQIRLIFNSFYNFLEDEEYVAKNPVKRIHKIKHTEVVKTAFTDEELERIRKSAKCIRDLAIIDLLYSSGMRLSECCALDIKDVSFVEREILVYGKGAKERVCYFNARTKIELLEYLSKRIDEEEALFVTLRRPFERIGRSAIQRMLADISKETGIPNVHPHRFRRTLATNLLSKGMSLEQVQTVLGHKNIQTTLIYAQVNQEQTKINHQKYTF